jgi:uncharacterized delta-60 repeat protein
MTVIFQKFILAVLLVILITGSSGSGDLVWVKSAGGESANGYGSGITTLSDNSIVATGMFEGSVTFGQGEPNQTDLTSTGHKDIFIAHYNQDGTLIWAKRAGGVLDDWGSGITTLSDNSTILTGLFDESATFGPGEPNQIILTSAEGQDIFIARYNLDGTLAWAKSAGGASCEQGNGATALSGNSTVVTGYFNQSITFGLCEPNQTILTSAGIDDIFIARYNPDGTLVWAKRAGGGDHDKGCGITALSDNSTIVTGCFDGSAIFGPGEPNETVLTSAGYEDIFLARYNPDGALAWAKRAGGVSALEQGSGISALSDNSIVVTGEFGYPDGGPATFGPGEANKVVLTSSGGQDIFIARYNPDGTLAWAKSAVGADSEAGYGITTLSDNSTVVTGYFSDSATFGLGEPSQTILTSAGEFDIFIACYNPDATLAWARSTRGEFAYYSCGITTLSDDTTVLTGNFSGSTTFGSGEPNETVITSAGDADLFIARFNP